MLKPELAVVPAPPTTPRAGDLVSVGHACDGLDDLVEVARRLEREAILLRNLWSRGWTLDGPVTDGHALLVDPTGFAGHCRDCGEPAVTAEGCPCEGENLFTLAAQA